MNVVGTINCIRHSIPFFMDNLKVSNSIRQKFNHSNKSFTNKTNKMACNNALLNYVNFTCCMLFHITYSEKIKCSWKFEWFNFLYNLWKFWLIYANEKDEDSTRGVIINTSSIAAFDGQTGQVKTWITEKGVMLRWYKFNQ